MQKKIYINVLLKDNMIVGWHISPNERTMPHDYYKDFIYANKSMENGRLEEKDNALRLNTLLQRTSNNIIKNSNYYKKEGYYNNLKD